MSFKMSMLKCYIFFVLIYGCKRQRVDPVRKTYESVKKLYSENIVDTRCQHQQRNVKEDLKPNKNIQLDKMNENLRYVDRMMQKEKYKILRSIIKRKIFGKQQINHQEKISHTDD